MRLKKPAAAAAAAPAATTSEDGTAPVAESAAAPASSSDAPSTGDASAAGAGAASAGGSISLLGVGGAAIKSGEERRGGRKRTPGEIRIQKGQLLSSLDIVFVEDPGLLSNLLI